MEQTIFTSVGVPLTIAFMSSWPKLGNASEMVGAGALKGLCADAVNLRKTSFGKARIKSVRANMIGIASFLLFI
jgi:hypothetical protein